MKFNTILLLEPRFLLCLQAGHKAREKRSRQSDVMSDLEHFDVMLRVYPRNQLDEQSEDENVQIDLSANGSEFKNSSKM